MTRIGINTAKRLKLIKSRREKKEYERRLKRGVKIKNKKMRHIIRKQNKIMTINSRGYNVISYRALQVMKHKYKSQIQEHKSRTDKIKHKVKETTYNEW